MADPKDSAHRPGERVMSPAQGGSTEMKKDAPAVADTAKQAAESAEQTIGEPGQQAASGAVEDARQQARAFAEDQKDQAAGQADGVARALRSAAGSLDDLLETVEDVARRQPVAVLGDDATPFARMTSQETS